MGMSLKGSEHHPGGRGNKQEQETSSALKLQMSTVRSRDVSPLHPSKIGCSFKFSLVISTLLLELGVLPYPIPSWKQETSATFIKPLKKIRSLTSKAEGDSQGASNI